MTIGKTHPTLPLVQLRDATRDVVYYQAGRLYLLLYPASCKFSSKNYSFFPLKIIYPGSSDDFTDGENNFSFDELRVINLFDNIIIIIIRNHALAMLITHEHLG